MVSNSDAVFDSSNKREVSKKNFIFKDKRTVLIKINKELFSKRAIIHSAFILIEDYYFFLDADEKYYIVELKGKSDSNFLSESDVFRFYNEVIEAESYFEQLKGVEKVREIILEKALLSQIIPDESSYKNNGPEK